MTTNLKGLLIGAAMVAGLAAPASAEVSDAIMRGAVQGLAEGLAGPVPQGTSAAATGTYPAGVVVVSCFRGPWRETIWDRPEPVFTDSLRAVGYDYATAESIANRICRDVVLVGDEAGLKAEMERIIRESPNFRQF